MALKTCPLKFNQHFAEAHTDVCLRTACAWWHKEAEECSMLQATRALIALSTCVGPGREGFGYGSLSVSDSDR